MQKTAQLALLRYLRVGDEQFFKRPLFDLRKRLKQVVWPHVQKITLINESHLDRWRYSDDPGGQCGFGRFGGCRELERRVDAGGPSENPTLRIVPKKFIETKVPMIDVFDCRVECQKIPIFSIAGEPYNKLLAQIGIQANADIIVFCGMGLIFDDFHFFRSTFENEGVFARSVMFVNQASDPIVERLLAPDLALKVAERFTVEENKRVLVFAQADGRGQAEASVGACRKAFSCQDYHTSSLHRAETPRRDVRTRQKTTFRFFVFPCRLTSAKNSNHQTPDFQQAASRKGRWVGCSGFLHLAAIRTIRRASRRKTENQIGFETGRILRSQQFEPAMIAFHYNTVPGNGNYP